MAEKFFILAVFILIRDKSTKKDGNDLLEVERGNSLPKIIIQKRMCVSKIGPDVQVKIVYWHENLETSILIKPFPNKLNMMVRFIFESHHLGTFRTEFCIPSVKFRKFLKLCCLINKQIFRKVLLISWLFKILLCKPKIKNYPQELVLSATQGNKQINGTLATASVLVHFLIIAKTRG